LKLQNTSLASLTIIMAVQPTKLQNAIELFEHVKHKRTLEVDINRMQVSIDLLFNAIQINEHLTQDSINIQNTNIAQLRKYMNTLIANQKHHKEENAKLNTRLDKMEKLMEYDRDQNEQCWKITTDLIEEKEKKFNDLTIRQKKDTFHPCISCAIDLTDLSD
jgi:outer membrane murein-binding lipoprotein Lpp